jgi:hypothetical protein
VVAGADGDAVAVEDLGDVVGVDPLDLEGDGAEASLAARGVSLDQDTLADVDPALLAATYRVAGGLANLKAMLAGGAAEKVGKGIARQQALIDLFARIAEGAAGRRTQGDRATPGPALITPLFAARGEAGSQFPT